MKDHATEANGLALGWTAALVALAVLWVRSPFLGERAAFLIWSGPAAVLSVISVRWIRKRDVREIPDSPRIRGAVGAIWLMALGLTVTDVGRTLALDALILRDPGLGGLGQLLRWTPLGFGCVISLAGLAAALEARYRIVNRPRTPATPLE